MAFTEYTDIGTNSSSLSTLLVETNVHYTGGYLGIVLVILIWVILFIKLMKNGSNSEAMTTSTFMCTLLSVILFALQLVPDWFVFTTIVLTTISFGWRYTENMG